MIGRISGVNPVYPAPRLQRADGPQLHGVQKAEYGVGVYATGRTAAPETPVEPVRPAPAVNADASGSIPVVSHTDPQADPARMWVEQRMKHLDDETGEVLPEEEAQSPREVMEEARCETCENRKYQDGSDDPGVSFQAPGHIDPDVAGTVVRGHEMEHVVREQAQAKLEEREVLRQMVILRNAICPECGRVYVSGGTTYTTTANVQRPGEGEPAAPEAGFDTAA